MNNESYLRVKGKPQRGIERESPLSGFYFWISHYFCETVQSFYPIQIILGNLTAPDIIILFFVIIFIYPSQKMTSFLRVIKPYFSIKYSAIPPPIKVQPLNDLFAI